MHGLVVAAFQLTYGDNHVQFARAEPGEGRKPHGARVETSDAPSGKAYNHADWNARFPRVC